MWLSQFPLTFHQTQNWDAPFHYIAFGYSRADQDSLCDHLRDVSWEDIFKLSSSAASEFCEWVQFGIDLYILHRQYQVKPHSSSWPSGFFCLQQQNSSSDSKVKASNCYKRVPEAAKLAYANKNEDSITSQKLGSQDHWRITNNVLNKDKSAILPLFNGTEVLSSASDKSKLFAKIFSENSHFDHSGISLPAFIFLNLRLLFVTPKMLKKVITSHDSSKTSGDNYIPVVGLENCEPELSYILAELFNKSLKEYCFPNLWKISSVVPVFKNVGESSTAKMYSPVRLLSVVSKIFEKLRPVDHLGKYGVFF